MVDFVIAFLSFVFTVMVFGLGSCVGSTTLSSSVPAQEAIEHGCAHYDGKTGKFTWNGEVK